MHLDIFNKGYKVHFKHNWATQVDFDEFQEDGIEWTKNMQVDDLLDLIFTYIKSDDFCSVSFNENNVCIGYYRYNGETSDILIEWEEIKKEENLQKSTCGYWI